MDTMRGLPYMSHLKGIGGLMKQSPFHFVVEEIPLYEAAGHGAHLYLTIKRKCLATRQVVDLLAELFKTPVSEVGYAGLKDRNALVTQRFSLPLEISESQVLRICQGAPLEILSQERHQNKLKVGHLLGNMFTIILTKVKGTLREAEEIAEVLRLKGCPNYFGEQRFGHDGANYEAGLRILKSGKKARGFKGKFLLSSLQSFIYNHYLAERMRQDFFDEVLLGDVCKKTQTGGLFVSEDAVLETERYSQYELTHTGPIFGQKMKLCRAKAYDFEIELLQSLGLSFEDMKQAGVGDRRANRLLLGDLKIMATDNPGELKFKFALPKGAYATTVMREFIKPENF